MLSTYEKVYIACGGTDMRKSINGLVCIVESKFNLSPFEKALFVFCNKTRDRMKILTWEDNGFWIHFKRLERGHFTWPMEDDNSTVCLTNDELWHIIRSPGVVQKLKRKDVKPFQMG